MRVKTSGRGAYVYTCTHNSFLWPVASLRLMVRNVLEGGNLSDLQKSEAIIGVFVRGGITNNTHITWKGQFGV